MTVIDYDKLANEYARHRRTYPGLIRHLVDHAGITADSTVLEVGCGTANHISAVQQETGARSLGLEPSAEMLAVARTQPATLELRQGRAEELDVPPGTLDLVFSVDVIHFVTDLESYFTRALAALKPGGYFCTVTDSEWNIRNRLPLSRFFPAAIEAELARFHPVGTLTDAMALAGFVEPHEATVESTYQLTDPKRFEEKAFSCLHLISEEDFRAGITALRAALAEGPVPGNLRSTVLWARRPR
ncbi:class I SAM-dependent methyltransferase [Micromonospora sp. NPDC023956]|uniref:class I SAM-dependent methyltransferase n=1 Tax=Micromonospora sp. NPDC023956 TaxID=3155722 RepID=UPI0033DE948C